NGREYALPDDVQALAVAVLAHRLLPTAHAQLNRRTAEQVVQEILQSTPVPAAAPQQSGFGPGQGVPGYGQHPPRRLRWPPRGRPGPRGPAVTGAAYARPWPG